MVDLLPLELEEDITLFKDLLKEFNEKTGSEVAADILNNFETLRQKIVKVFPQEYQRALKQMAEQSVKPEVEVKQNRRPEGEGHRGLDSGSDKTG